MMPIKLHELGEEQECCLPPSPEHILEQQRRGDDKRVAIDDCSLNHACPLSWCTGLGGGGPVAAACCSCTRTDVG